jgi:hypothetical protein
MVSGKFESVLEEVNIRSLYIVPQRTSNLTEVNTISRQFFEG